ncbi:MAG: hypothetical protein L0332_06340 [Chloroflexi bacterium]|nr:hypothetical protein [Chloroflexota bacterium]MCI0577019.1 hypothetical protein [Chloroflexota bacterium]MCI0648825.1 hypothetical protein [Chloroflexota bacterium]MCI0726327.1 hypothetical protein [Chloroflexota bacterium]
MSTKTTRFLALLAFLLLFVAGCAAPDEVFEVQVEPVAESTPAATVLDEVQPVLEAILSGSIDGRRALVEYVTTACTTADGLGGPPKCVEVETDGTPVQVFPAGGPETSFVRPAEIDNTLNFTVKGLYAVYETVPAADQPDYWPAGEYALLFERDQNDYPLPIVAIVQDGRLVRLEYYMGVQAAEVLGRVPVNQVVIQPQEAQELTAEMQP